MPERYVEVADPWEKILALSHENERLREALSVLPPYLKAANAGDTGAIPLALDMISAALTDQRQP